MPVYVKTAGVWKVWNTTPTQDSAFVKIGGAWISMQQATSGGFWVKVAGVWKVVDTD